MALVAGLAAPNAGRGCLFDGLWLLLAVVTDDVVVGVVGGMAGDAFRGAPAACVEDAEAVFALASLRLTASGVLVSGEAVAVVGCATVRVPRACRFLLVEFAAAFGFAVEREPCNVAEGVGLVPAVGVASVANDSGTSPACSLARAGFPVSGSVGVLDASVSWWRRGCSEALLAATSLSSSVLEASAVPVLSAVPSRVMGALHFLQGIFSTRPATRFCHNAAGSRKLALQTSHSTDKAITIDLLPANTEPCSCKRPFRGAV